MVRNNYFEGVSTIEFFIIGESTVNKPLIEIKKFIIGEPLPKEVIVLKPEQKPNNDRYSLKLLPNTKLNQIH